jgi:hypothetical protein
MTAFQYKTPCADCKWAQFAWKDGEPLDYGDCTHPIVEKAREPIPMVLSKSKPQIGKISRSSFWPDVTCETFAWEETE